MSSLAQEESRSISENVTWGHRKRFADGKVSFPYSRFLGLDKAADGTLVVNEEEAKTVKLIFGLFLEGMTPFSIAAELTRRKLKTPTGKEKWCQQTVKSILQNEKYRGDVLLQKTCTTDFLTKTRKKNDGLAPQFYIENNHDAIILPQAFEMVQAELERRNDGSSRYSGISILSHKIKCAECGGWYGSKVWHSTDRYRKIVYRCNQKYKGSKCQTPHLTEEEIKAAFISAFNQLLSERAEVIANAEKIKTTLCQTERLEAEKKDLEDEKALIGRMVQDAIDENARVAQDQSEYARRYEALLEKYNSVSGRLDEVANAIIAKERQRNLLASFIRTLKAQPILIAKFDGQLWSSMVDYMTVSRDKTITVIFKDGTKIKAKSK